MNKIIRIYIENFNFKISYKTRGNNEALNFIIENTYYLKDGYYIVSISDKEYIAKVKIKIQNNEIVRLGYKVFEIIKILNYFF